MAERSPVEQDVDPAVLVRIELRLIEQVIEIVRSGSFSSAARKLRLSQPALSKSIARLESQLGVLLFDRDGGAARPTGFGRLVADRGRSLLGGAAELSREITQLASGGRGALRIGVGPATRLKPLPEVVSRLLDRHPDLQVTVRQENGARIARGVDDGRFDLAFVYNEGAEPFGDLIRICIFTDRQVALVRPEHPLAGSKGEVCRKELLRHRWASSGVTPSFKRWLGELTTAELRNTNAMISDDFEMLSRIALRADYIVRGPRFIFARAMEERTLLEIPTSYDASYECWMLTTETLWRSPLIKEVAEIAKGCIDGPARA